MTLAQRDPALHERLHELAGAARTVVVAGLPGTGKSLVIHQLTHLAAAAGRAVHLLQWDVARPVVEASTAGRRYPVVNGVTHAMIRAAVGLWARRALASWHRDHPAPEHLLVVEAPLVGGRLIELARPADDAAEPLLTDRATRFVIAVPSVEVRRHVEAERDRRAAHPLHPREREDAPPQVLRDLWRQVAIAARDLGLSSVDGAVAYDPLVYRQVFETVLRDRRPESLLLDTILRTAAMSVYDFGVPYRDLVPQTTEADALVAEAERRHPDRAALARRAERWWVA